MIRVETVFSALLLPASLSFVSAVTFSHDHLIFILAQWGLVAFFATYLLVLLRDLLRLERREQQVKALQDRLYSLPASEDSKKMSELPDLGTAYDAIEAGIGPTLLTRPSVKILISAGVALVAMMARALQ